MIAEDWEEINSATFSKITEAGALIIAGQNKNAITTWLEDTKPTIDKINIAIENEISSLNPNQLLLIDKFKIDFKDYIPSRLSSLGILQSHLDILDYHNYVLDVVKEKVSRYYIIKYIKHSSPLSF